MAIVRDTWEACDPGYTIIFHLSLLDLMEGGSTWEEVKMLATSAGGRGRDHDTRQGFMSDAMCVGHAAAERSSLAC